MKNCQSVFLLHDLRKNPQTMRVAYTVTRLRSHKADVSFRSCYVVKQFPFSRNQGNGVGYALIYFTRDSRPRSDKTFFMLNWAWDLNVQMYKKKYGFLGSDKHRMLFFPLINVKMPTIVGILTFMSRNNFMLSWVEHEKSVIPSGPG